MAAGVCVFHYFRYRVRCTADMREMSSRDSDAQLHLRMIKDSRLAQVAVNVVSRQ